VKKKILSVDDSAIIRKMIKNRVELLNFEFLEASDGNEALAVLAREYRETCLILLDWNMPGMNGINFLKKVKEPGSSYKNIPIIMVTTESEKASIVQAIQLGVANYLLKPFTPEELTQKIKACI
jgi:two-component system chemotaxis response regulator CheY